MFSRPLSSLRTQVGGRQLAPRQPCWSSYGAASAPSLLIRSCCVEMATSTARCNFCRSDTPLRDLVVGDTFQDRRQPGQQDAAPDGSPTVHQPFQSSQPVPQATPSTRARFRQLLAELRRASAMAVPRCIVSRNAMAWAECLEGAISGHQFWAVLCRYPCRLLLVKVPKGTDRIAELKLRLRL